MSLRKAFSIREVPAKEAGRLAPFFSDIKRAIDSLSQSSVTINELVSIGLGSVGSDGGLEGPIIDDENSTSITPPAPTGVIVTGGFATIIIEYGGFSYKGHSYAEIVRGTSSDYSAAVAIATSNYGIHVDQVGVSSPLYYYWVRFVSKAGRTGPPDSMGGTSARSSPNPTALLDLLTGYLTATQLDATLRGRIDLIDTPTTGLVTLMANANSSVTALQARVSTLESTPDYDNAVTYATDAIVKYAGGLYKALSSTTGNPPTNTTYWLKIGDYASLGDAVAAHTAQLTDHESRITTTTSGLAAEISTRTTLSATVTSNNTAALAAISTEASARASADAAIVSAATTLAATVAANTSAITVETTARATADSAMASQITGLLSSSSDNAAAIFSEATTRASADAAIVTTATALAATVAANTAAISTEASARATADTAIVSTATTLAATVASNNTAVFAAIATESSARATADSAITSSVTTLQSTVDGNTAAISTEASTRATQTGELYAQYTVKTDVAGLVSGYGLASTANNAAPTSAFGVRASSFYVAPPSVAQSTAPTDDLFVGYTWLDTSVTPNVTRYYDGTAWVTTPTRFPFIIQTTPVTINGVVAPPGVYMDTVFVRNGSIGNALIGNASIDDLKVAAVSAGKLTAGSIAVGAYIQSTAYVAGSAGWRIHGDGTAELSQVIVRGAVFASSGTFAGSLSAATGTFAGSLSAASGTFTGTVTAGGVELGADVGPGTGHSGLALSSSDYNDIFLKRNSDGVRFFRINAGGDNSLTFDSASGVLAIRGSLSATSIATNSGLFTVDSAGKLTAIEADIQRRVVLQTGSYSPGGYVTDLSGGNSGSPGMVVVQVPAPILIPTDVYDSYLVNNSVCQKFGVSFHAEGTAFASGSTDFQFTATGEAVVNRTYSAGGVNTANDTRVYISVTNLICTFLGFTGYVTWPSFRWKLYKL